MTDKKIHIPAAEGSDHHVHAYSHSHDDGGSTHDHDREDLTPDVSDRFVWKEGDIEITKKGDK